MGLFRERVKELLPPGVRRFLGHVSGSSRSRRLSNRWLQAHCADVLGDVLSIGTADDSDGHGRSYRDYFVRADSYVTSDVTADFGCDLVLDVRSMPEIADETYDAVFCSGVLEHVDDFRAAFDEITRILRPRGTLLLGLPFRQAIHMEPQDFWRFTEYGIRHLLGDRYEIIDLAAIPARPRSFPETYWLRAVKR